MTLPRSVAFLRGINVGGHRVTKDELIAVFADLGLGRVDTFLASGNVLFEPGQAVTDSEMGAALETTLGYAVPTTVRTAGELEALNQAEPFPAEAVEAMGKPQVMLLFAEPTAEVEAAVLDLATDADLLAFGPGALHWLPAGGISDTALDLKEISRLVGVNTIRTANTIRRLVAKL